MFHRKNPCLGVNISVMFSWGNDQNLLKATLAFLVSVVLSRSPTHAVNRQVTDHAIKVWRAQMGFSVVLTGWLHVQEKLDHLLSTSASPPCLRRWPYTSFIFVILGPSKHLCAWNRFQGKCCTLCLLGCVAILTFSEHNELQKILHLACFMFQTSIQTTKMSWAQISNPILLGSKKATFCCLL